MPKAIKIKLIFLFIATLSILFSNYCFARDENTVLLTDDRETYEIGPYLEILEDKFGTLTIDDVASPAFNRFFIKNNKNTLNYGYTPSVYWVRFKISDRSGKTYNWLLEQGFEFMYYIDIYEPAGIKNQYIIKKTGFLRPARSRDIKHHKLAFNLSLSKGAEKIFYLRFKSENAMIINLTIQSKEKFFSSTSIEYFIIGLFYGILLIMLGYNLFLFISLRTLDYFYYITILLSLLVMDLAFTGIGPYYIWPDSTRFNYMSMNLSTSFLLICIMKFTEVFVDMKNKMPGLYILSVFISLLQAVFIILAGFVRNSLLIPPLTLIFLAGSTLSFAASIISLYQGNKKAYYHIAGWLMLLAGVCVFISMPFKIFPFNEITKNFHKPAIVMVIVFWSLAIGDRINILRKKLEITNRDLERSEEKLRTVFNQSFQLTALLSVEGNVIAANETALNLLNIKETDVLGRPFWETPWWAYSKEQQVKLKEAVKAAATGETTRFIAADFNPGSFRRVIDFSLKPVRDKDGKIILLMPEGRDITQAIQAEEESKRLIAIMESTVDLVATCTEDGSLRYMNKAGRKMLGLPENGSLEDKNISDAHPASALKIIIEEGIPAAIRDGTWKGETIIQTSDGKEINVSQIIMAHKSAEGKLLFLSSTMHDITDRIEAELALIKSEEQYRTTINSIKDMIHVVDRDLNIILINTYMTEMNKSIGIETDVIGKNIIRIFPFLNEKVIQEYRNVLSTGDMLISEETTHIKDKEFITETRKIPILEQGIVTKIITVIRDITEKKQIEDQLRQAQKMEIVGTLAGGLAHDFNNALNGIIGSVTLMQYQMQDSEIIEKGTMSEYIGIILKSSQRAADMIQRLLTLSRKRELKINPIDLNITLEQVMKICEQTFDKSIKIIPGYFKNRAIAMADATLIEQVLLNICVNAEHAMTFMRRESKNWGGTLTIDLKHIFADKYFRTIHPEAEECNYWVFSVADTGIGMDSETLSKIFNPFFTTKEDGKGTGLGLSMAYGIIKQHKGFIDINSKMDEGTTLSIYLPVPEEVRVIPEVKKDKSNFSIPAGNGLILVTDDEEITRQTAKNMLEACGYSVITAKNGLECVEIYGNRYSEISAVLLDMSMPKMSGKDAYIKIKEINPDVKVLFSSGFKQDSRINEVLKLGVHGFIQKPYTFEQLAEYMHKVVNNTDDFN